MRPGLATTGPGSPSAASRTWTGSTRSSPSARSAWWWSGRSPRPRIPVQRRPRSRRGSGRQAEPLARLDPHLGAVAVLGQRALPAIVVAARRVIGEVQVHDDRVLVAPEISALR